MAYPKIRLIYNRRKTATRAEAAAVEIVVTYNRQRCWVSTGVRVTLPHWNDRLGMVVRHVDMEGMNRQITSRVDDVREKIDMLWRDGTFSIEALKAAMKQRAVVAAPLDWIEQRIMARDIAEGTRKQHIVALKMWRRSGLFASWSDFTLDTIEKYDAMLRGKVSRATLYNYHKRLKVYINDAVAHGLLASSPYSLFKAKKVDDVSTIKFLTDEELERLRGVKLSGPLDRVRDCFLFCTYTGISYADMAALKPTDLIHEDGGTYFEKKRKKTGVSFRVLLIDEALALLGKYGGTLPVITNQKYNYFLKIVATAAGIDKPLTSHMARHTFATFALRHGVPHDVIAAMLGHAGLREVDRYAKRLQEDVDKQYIKLEKAFRAE
jgi:integrase